MKSIIVFKNIAKIWPMVIICILIYLTGCLDIDDPNMSNPIRGEGLIVEMPIEVDSFNQVNHVAVGDMNIIFSDTFSVVLKAQQNILELMDWLVKDETFYWGFSEPVEIIEALDILCEIKLPVNIESAIITGVGVIRIRGPKQDIVYLEIDGVGTINAFELEVDKAEVLITGVGEIQVNVIDEIEGLISGNGNIIYRGDPVLNVHITGTGDVVKDE